MKSKERVCVTIDADLLRIVRARGLKLSFILSNLLRRELDERAQKGQHP